MKYENWTVKQIIYIVYAIRSLYHDENFAIMAIFNGLLSNSKKIAVFRVNESSHTNMCDDILLRVPNVSKKSSEMPEKKRRRMKAGDEWHVEGVFNAGS